MLRLSLQTTTAAAPLALPRAGPALADHLLRDPAGQPAQRVAADRRPGDRLRVHVGVQHLHGRDPEYRPAVPALDRLLGDGDDPVPDHRLPAGLLHGVQGRALEERDPAADHPAVLRLLRAADGGLAADPVGLGLGRGAPARRRPGRRGRAAAGLADGGDRGHHLQLPAVHDPAAVRVAGEDRPAADRGGHRPLREPHDGVPQGDGAARAAGHLRRLAADLHPGLRRLHQRRAARHAAAST